MQLSHIFCAAMPVGLLSMGSAFAGNPPADGYPTYQNGS